MGSINDDTNYAKGEHPALSWVQTEIDEWNKRCQARAAAVPTLYKILAILGMRKHAIKWQQDHWYDSEETLMRTRSKQAYAPHRHHGLRLEEPDDVDPEVFSPEATEEDLAPYTRDRRTVDGDDAR